MAFKFKFILFCQQFDRLFKTIDGSHGNALSLSLFYARVCLCVYTITIMKIMWSLYEPIKWRRIEFEFSFDLSFLRTIHLTMHDY